MSDESKYKSLPVPYHPTFDVLDSSKIQQFQDCPRGFFYRYILGWTSEEESVHLAFGRAWHDAMEHIYQNGSTPQVAAEAYEKFVATYRKSFPNEMTDGERAPKNPATAFNALGKYIGAFRGTEMEVLFTEVAAAVPIREDRVIHAKCDAIVRVDGSIWSHEHKTSGRNSASWRDQWNIKLQIDTYSHLLFSAFPGEHIEGVMINGAIFTKSKGAEFLRIPVRKRPEDMMSYLWEVNHWVDQIEWNMSELARTTPDDPVMPCFPKNGESCSKFGCKYPGLCGSWSNPLKNMHRMPPGYVVEYWDPRKREEEAKYFARPDGTRVIIEERKTEENK